MPVPPRKAAEGSTGEWFSRGQHLLSEGRRLRASQSEEIFTAVNSLLSAEGGLAAVFAASFLAATLIPLSSEAVLSGYLRLHPEHTAAAIARRFVSAPVGAGLGFKRRDARTSLIDIGRHAGAQAEVFPGAVQSQGPAHRRDLSLDLRIGQVLDVAPPRR